MLNSIFTAKTGGRWRRLSPLCAIGVHHAPSRSCRESAATAQDGMPQARQLDAQKLECQDLSLRQHILQLIPQRHSHSAHDAFQYAPHSNSYGRSTSVTLSTACSLTSLLHHHHLRSQGCNQGPEPGALSCRDSLSHAAFHSAAHSHPESSKLTPKRKMKRSPVQQLRLEENPPGSAQWNSWVEALCTVPNIGLKEATQLMFSHPELLKYSAVGVSSRLSEMAELLDNRLDLSKAGFADLLQSFPPASRTGVQQASLALTWFKDTLQVGPIALRKIFRHQPRFLAFSAEELDRRLRALMDLNFSMNEARSCIIHSPGLLTIPSYKLVLRLNLLSAVFNISSKELMQAAAHALLRKPEHLMSRAAFLQHLSGISASISEVWVTTSDARFADFKVRGYLKRTGKLLSLLCHELKHLPGMDAALDKAGLPLDITTPIHCLQAHNCLWLSQYMAAQPTTTVKATRNRVGKIKGLRKHTGDSNMNIDVSHHD